MSALGERYAKFTERNLLDIPDTVEKQEATPQDDSRSVLHTYLFLDTTKGDLISYNSFGRALKELRHGMIAVARYYVGGKMSVDLQEAMVNEVLASHSAKKGLSVCAFSLSSHSGTTATLLQEQAAEGWISWLQVEESDAVRPGLSKPTNRIRPRQQLRRFRDLVGAVFVCLAHHSGSAVLCRKEFVWRPRCPKLQ